MKYTFIELSEAKYVLANCHKTYEGNATHHMFMNTEAKPLFSPEVISWAKDVVKWFKALYTIARLYKRVWKLHWTLALKAVWSYIRTMPFAGKLFTLLRWVTNEARTRMRASSEVDYVLSRTTSSYVTVPSYIAKEQIKGASRSAKSSKAIRYRALTESLQERYGKGHWAY